MKKLLQGIGLILGLGYLALNFNKIHKQYLVNEVGTQTVTLMSPEMDSGGTGFAVRYKGKVYTLTNDHVCRLAVNNHMVAKIQSTNETLFLRVLDQSEKTDLCLLEGIPSMIGITIGDPSDYYYLYILGHPRLMPLTLTHGYVIYRETITITRFDLEEAGCVLDKHVWSDGLCYESIQSLISTAWIAPGSSGSPAVDALGRLKGVVFAGNGIVSAIIPVEYVKEFLEEYRSSQ